MSWTQVNEAPEEQGNCVSRRGKDERPAPWGLWTSRWCKQSLSQRWGRSHTSTETETRTDTAATQRWRVGTCMRVRKVCRWYQIAHAREPLWLRSARFIYTSVCTLTLCGSSVFFSYHQWEHTYSIMHWGIIKLRHSRHSSKKKCQRGQGWCLWAPIQPAKTIISLSNETWPRCDKLQQWGMGTYHKSLCF